MRWAKQTGMLRTRDLMEARTRNRLGSCVNKEDVGAFRDKLPAVGVEVY